MTPKEEKFFRRDIWYHGTTFAQWKSICHSGILAEYNLGDSLDFGSGFYLSPGEKDTQRYALSTVKYNGEESPEENIPVVLVFRYSPYEDIISGATYKYFGKYDDEFAKFVFECRDRLGVQPHTYEITGGVMTDSIPTVIMQKYFANQISKHDAMECFKKSTSKKQLCLHTQKLCDKLKLIKAYIVEGKELDINEYQK